MIVNINLIGNNTRTWFSQNENGVEIWVKGFVFLNNDLYSGEGFAKLLNKTTNSQADIIEVLKIFNGSFAFIIKKENIVLAAVDILRSMPLFYSYKNNELCISDEAYWVRDKTGDTKIDPIAEAEFLHTGYVTGQDTLYTNTKQLQAGELLLAETSNGEITLKSYHSYIFNAALKDTTEELLLKLDEIFLNVFKRLVKWLDGRPAVVPLSGGYDSRLIVLMLKRLHYEKIVTFTFGRPGNMDSVISEKVARQLGIPWKFVEYNNDLWYKWFHSEERKKYYRFADGLCSLPLFTLLPAVKELKKQNVFPDNSVFIQGHTLITIMPIEITGICDKNMLINDVIKTHYSLWPFDYCHKNIAFSIKKKISDLLDNFAASSDWHKNAFGSWFVRERETKFIVNSVRIFEFFGYEWNLPYWDNEFVEFWENIPLDLRINKKLFILYVDNLYKNYTGLNQDTAEGLQSKIKAKNNRGLHKYIHKITESIKKNLLYKRNAYYRHPWASYGIMSKKQFDKLYTGREEKFAFHTLEYLGKITYD